MIDKYINPETGEFASRQIHAGFRLIEDLTKEEILNCFMNYKQRVANAAYFVRDLIGEFE